ncbi:MAG TPA: MarR family winged helix-turn-helix transcriptional regulator [Solirubrobacteraceae bacterium]|jgi:DNA-binding MarR family transcriptional regulator|nr:MarR family winged helix-turn-helix transcriptional regulator [Solirubrobacteraceae bacterium]
MSPKGSDSASQAPEDRAADGVAFLLAQIGAHAASQFAERLRPHGLRPPEAGVLGRLARAPGQSQRGLADALGMHAPRLVALVDDLEARGLVERQRDPSDRRNYAISLTDAGRRAMRQIASVARQHERALTAALEDEERAQLAALLRRIADEQALTPGVHPGFRRIGRRG